MRQALPVVLAVAAVVTASLTATATVHADPAAEAGKLDLAWNMSETGVENQFRGLAAVDTDTAWVSGTAGMILRTTDGGDGWEDVSPPDAAGLEFRDIEATDDQHAVALTIGEGSASQIFVTDDGGSTWHKSFTNDEDAAFYNCMAFFDPQNGIAMSDPVDGRMRFVTTDDGGHSWEELPDSNSPESLDGEVAFSASGQCLVTSDENNAYLVTGGGDSARIHHTPDRGETWSTHDTPIVSGEAAGINAAMFRPDGHGIVVGGNFNTPEDGTDAAGYTEGNPDEIVRSAEPPGAYRSSVSHVISELAVTVGPTGSDLTMDGGETWRQFDDGAFDTVECVSRSACWASGPEGRVATLAVS